MHTIFAPTRDTTDCAVPAPLYGVALVIHGLNVKPECMQPLADALRCQGIAVVRCALRGHGENYTPLAGCSDESARLIAFHQVSYQGWRAEVAAAYQQAVTYAGSTGAPIFLVAFSLGALLGCDLLATAADVRFARMILLAPALALHAYCHLPALLAHWPQLSIRSRAPSFYRANRVTPIDAYHALYTALRHLHHQPGAALNIPTLVLIDPADELVSAQGIERFVLNKRLTQWQLHPIHKAPAQTGHTVRHLILDPASVGAAVWQHMLEQITMHLCHKQIAVATDDSINV